MSEADDIESDARAVPRRWRHARVVLGLVMAAGFAWFVFAHRTDVTGALDQFDDLDVGWVVAAALAEALSLVCFALTRFGLLVPVGVEVGLGRSVAVTLASNAIATSIPAGSPIATAYSYQHFRRCGADGPGATWAILAGGVATASILVMLSLISVVIAGGGSNIPVAIPLILGVILVIAFVAALRHPRRLQWLVVLAVRFGQFVARRKGDARVFAATLVERLASVRLTARDAISTGLRSAGLWVFDLACLCCALVATSTGVPWSKVMLAYVAAQLVASIPITPGGLGILEGGLTVTLTAVGVPASKALAAVLVYRLLAFWAPIPIGWACWVALRSPGAPSSTARAPGT